VMWLFSLVAEGIGLWLALNTTMHHRLILERMTDNLSDGHQAAISKARTDGSRSFDHRCDVTPWLC